MTGRSASVLAQAKVNLFLRVLAREAGGYHQIETLFCRVLLGDTVAVRATNGSRALDVAGEALPDAGLGPVEQNLAWRAAVAYQEAAGWPAGFEIAIEKRIPVGAGLGGGSADAGGVLRALDALAPAPLPTGRLLQLAASLGADVPFLTQEAATLALGWGRGERLLLLPPLPARPCVVHQPDLRIATTDAYRWLAESPGPAAGATSLTMAELGTWASVSRMAVNAFEPVIFGRFPACAAFVRTCRGLPDLVDLAMLSGSGSASFALPASSTGDMDGAALLQLVATAGLTILTRTASVVAGVELSDPG